MILTDKDKDLAFDEKFFQKLYKEMEDILAYGIPYEDRKGHGTTIRFNVSKSFMPLIGQLKELLPEGWYYSSSKLYRTIFALGLKTYQLILQDYGVQDGTKLKEFIDRFNMVQEIMKDLEEAELKRIYSDVTGKVIDFEKPIQRARLNALKLRDMNNDD
jgi:hypothetical protein